MKNFSKEYYSSSVRRARCTVSATASVLCHLITCPDMMVLPSSELLFREPTLTIEVQPPGRGIFCLLSSMLLVPCCVVPLVVRLIRLEMAVACFCLAHMFWKGRIAQGVVGSACDDRGPWYDGVSGYIAIVSFDFSCPALIRALYNFRVIAWL